MNKYLFFVVLILSLFSCKKETETVDIDTGVEFFPLEVGKYKIYQVDSIFFNENNIGSLTDTSSYFIKEEYIDKLKDNLGVDYFVVKRTQKINTDDTWSNPVIFKEQIDGNKALRTEHNRKFVKIVMPVVVFKQWDFGTYLPSNIQDTIPGGRIEIFKNWSPYISTVEESITFNNQTFSEAATVVYAESENGLELREAREIYAKNVGLISKEMRIFDTQDIGSTAPWEIKTENGFVIHQSIIEFN